MSHLSEDVELSLKVMMNKQKTKVLFAEADSEFAEVMLGFLTMPLGEIVSFLKRRYEEEEPVIGSLNTLYTGLLNLDNAHFWTDGGKKMLLNPRNSFFSQPVKYFKCREKACNSRSFPDVSIYYNSGRCGCGNRLNSAMSEMKPASSDGILAEGLSFFVTDDLQMSPYEPGSISQTSVDLSIVVSEGAELMNVTLGYDEILDLLEASLISKKPLTDVILGVSNNADSVLEDSLDDMEPSSTNSARMTVTAVIEESTSKLLFVETGEDFVDFIFGFLTIPLGRVLSLLGSKTSLKGIDNVYKTATNHIDDKHLMTKHTKKRLLEPELPPFYVSKKQIFSLSEATAPPIYYCASITDSSDRMIQKGFWMSYQDPKGDEGCYVKRHGKFFIYDDLAVEAWGISSGNAIFSKLKTRSSDAKRMEMQIGLKEGLSILKASLASSSALTDGLINPFLKKQLH